MSTGVRLRPRRRILAAAIGTVVVLLLAGCGAKPPGVDGALLDDWAAPPAPKGWIPTANTCHLIGFVPTPTVAAYQPVDCATSHRIETVHVGTFGERSTPPAAGSPEQRAAYAECLTKVTEFLGADWRTGRLWLGLAVPTEAAWDGGSRWYRCDLWEIKDRDDPDDVSRSATLKDILRGTRSLGFTCFAAAVKDDKVSSMTATDCTKPHNAEFAGVYVAADVTFPKTDKERNDLAFNGCRGIVAGYVNVPNDGNFYRRTGLITTRFSEQEWDQGNRGFLCHLWVEKNVTRSLKGTGTGGLPLS